MEKQAHSETVMLICLSDKFISRAEAYASAGRRKMKIHDNTGMKLTDALDWALKDLQERYQISRADARKLLAEAIIRNCVWEAIIEQCDWQLGKEKRYE